MTHRFRSAVWSLVAPRSRHLGGVLLLSLGSVAATGCGGSEAEGSPPLAGDAAEDASDGSVSDSAPSADDSTIDTSAPSDGSLADSVVTDAASLLDGPLATDGATDGANDSADVPVDSAPPKCTSNGDCVDAGGGAFCDTTTGACVACVADGECALGRLCVGNSCVAGCSITKACPTGETCCGSTCHDLKIDSAHCGTCPIACPSTPNATPWCEESACKTKCLEGFADCDRDPANGCEHSLSAGACVCTPGEVANCYDGAEGTKDVAPCKGGQRTCAASGLAWGACVGQVIPIAEICANAVDDDCDGAIDIVPDADGDGWTRCNGDCCDSTADGCTDPKLLNPGAYEIVGNGLDDDCDPATSDTVPTPTCSTAAKLTVVTAADAANAMELCQTTTVNAPLAQKKWGLLSAQWLRADGTLPAAAQLTSIQDRQGAVLVNYGTGGVAPRKGTTMLGMSTGWMRDQGDPGYVAPSNGSDFGFTGTAPAGYLAAHGGTLRPTDGCNGAKCPPGTGANDSINLRLTIRVPTNAKSFSYDLRYFSAEYSTWSCTSFNDYFLALLKTTSPGIPVDGNISFDVLGNPFTVNNRFIQVCAPKGCSTCPYGVGPLAGTGMQVTNIGGGTPWLTTSAPVVPGETMVLDLTIFDVTDKIVDSNVLLDHFRWNTSTSAVVTATQ